MKILKSLRITASKVSHAHNHRMKRQWLSDWQKNLVSKIKVDRHRSTHLKRGALVRLKEGVLVSLISTHKKIKANNHRNQVLKKTLIQFLADYKVERESLLRHRHFLAAKV